MFNNNIIKNTPLLALIALTTAFLLGSTGMALAQAASLGDIMCNAFNNTIGIATGIQYAAYTIGALMAVQGIYHLRGHTESPQNFPMHRGIMLLGGASVLLALPSAASVIVNSVFTTAGSNGSLACTGGAVGGGGAGLDQMLSGFVSNIKGPLVSLVSIISIVAGIFMIVRGLTKAGKYGFDPKTHSVQSILTHIVFGALLMSIGDNLNMMMTSVFGSSGISTSSVISWSFLNGLAGGTSTQFQTAVEAGLTFVQLIGVIAFVRGWMVMKKVVEGGGNVTMAQGITHIVGGVLAINIYAFLKLMDTTFGTGLL